MKVLQMTVGLPLSGKTTYAKSTGYPIVCPDAIRLALHGERFIGNAEPMVWAIAKYMVAALFEAGHDDVVLDATNTTAKRRAEWIDKRWMRAFVPIPTTFDECMRRAKANNDDRIIPTIEKMHKQFEPVVDAEYQDWEK